MRPESQGNNSMLGEDAAKVRPLDLSDGNNNAQQELASTPATGSATLATEPSPFIPSAASLIAPMLESPLQVLPINMAGPSSASSSPMRDSSNSSLASTSSMTPRNSKTGTTKQRRKAKAKVAHSSGSRASSSNNKRGAKPLQPQDKLRAIECVLIHGQTKASVARTYRVPESTLRGWCKTHVALESKKRQEEMDSSASSARSDSPLTTNPLPYPSLAARTADERRQQAESDTDAQFESMLPKINPNVFPEFMKDMWNPNAPSLNHDAVNTLVAGYNKLAHVTMMANNLSNNIPSANISQMVANLVQNPLFVPDSLQYTKSNLNNKKSAAQTSQTPFPTDLINKYISQVREEMKNAKLAAPYLTNTMLSTNNRTNDHKSQHTIAWVSQQQQLQLQEQQHKQQKQQKSQPKPIQQQLQQQQQQQQQQQHHQQQQQSQQSQQQAANLLNGGTFSNVNSTGWPYVTATPTVNSTSLVTSTVTSQNFNNKPSRGVRSISDNPLLSSQPSINHDLDQCLNLTKEKKGNNSQANGSTMTEEDMEAGLTLGEKFMQFLEGCGDPSVTQVQLNTLRSVIEKLKVKDRKSPILKRCRKQTTHKTLKK